ncbi:MAG: hypothetical protein K1X74_21695, partial [Pirellulales bacterium]|nr:hypothetical protein [Pirellulales bacterium]
MCVVPAWAQLGNFDRAPVVPAEENAVFTPPGSDRPGKPATIATGPSSTVRLRIVDAATARPTYCRVNVIGSDGNFYQPGENPY